MRRKMSRPPSLSRRNHIFAQEPTLRSSGANLTGTRAPEDFASHAVDCRRRETGRANHFGRVVPSRDKTSALCTEQGRVISGPSPSKC